MASPWKDLPDEQPADQQVCYTRLSRWFDPPFLATWNATPAAWVLYQLPGAAILGWMFAPHWRPA